VDNTENKPAAEQAPVVPAVDKPVHPDVLKDLASLKKERQELNEKFQQAEQRARALEAEKEAALEAGLIEGRKYKELFERRDQYSKKRDEDVSKLEQKLAETETKYITNFKVNSVTAALGGFKHASYAKAFIKAENIKTNDDGTIDMESHDAEVARIKQEHPELLKGGDAKPLPANSASTSTSAPTVPDISKMSQSEQNKFWQAHFAAKSKIK
jgi:hypothetical protein